MCYYRVLNIFGINWHGSNIMSKVVQLDCRIGVHSTSPGNNGCRRWYDSIRQSVNSKSFLFCKALPIIKSKLVFYHFSFSFRLLWRRWPELQLGWLAMSCCINSILYRIVVLVFLGINLLLKGQIAPNYCATPPKMKCFLFWPFWLVKTEVLLWVNKGFDILSFVRSLFNGVGWIVW